MSASGFQETLTLTRRFQAPIERVFEAWTKAEMLTLWFGPEGFTVIRALVDCCEGGQYEITIKSPDNNTIKHYGEYIHIEVPNKLIFTWILEDQSCQGSEGQHAKTLVEIDFKALENATEITLKHEKLPNLAAYEGHQFGWLSSFDSLSRYLTE